MKNQTGRILVVDDSENNLLFVTEALKVEGYTVANAHDGVDALDMFEKYQPDLVVTDLLMPRLSGFVVCQRIKQNPRTQSIPVIAMSGLTDLSDKVRALELGADCFIYKPIDNLELTVAVRTLLRAHRCQVCLDQLKREATTSKQEITRAIQQLDQPLFRAGRDQT